MSAFWSGLHAVAAKEVRHALRDRLTLALLISVPLVQMLLFGYAINLHPKSLPTALVAYEDDAFTARAVRELEALGYFQVTVRTDQPALADLWLARSEVQFVLQLPRNLGRSVLAHAHPLMTLVADATDPVASIVATQAAAAGFGPKTSDGDDRAFRLQIENRFNAEGRSRNFILPGLLGVVLTLTLVLLGAFCFVREHERGTDEMLLTLPIPAAAVLLGKFLPYFALGMLLFGIMLGLSMKLLDLPWLGGAWAIAITAVLFVTANLALGIALSLIARNQMQAMQLGVFFYLPSMLLSGFMFPFFGMPAWARSVGEILPLTHFLRVIRGLLLKSLAPEEIWILIWPIALFAMFAALVALWLFHRRLH